MSYRSGGSDDSILGVVLKNDFRHTTDPSFLVEIAYSRTPASLTSVTSLSSYELLLFLAKKVGSTDKLVQEEKKNAVAKVSSS
jgi:hypothetical protein